ncbi:DUF397 domain-containing protein [Streptomyces griseorubiginosus]|uniref:DUF397 domain-containing protein n=1 Tax=Streptomyces griseorubiginosus TaxID=67304 RepID=UPI0036251561
MGGVCLAGSFNLLRFDDDPDIVCTKDLPDLGPEAARPGTLREATLRSADSQGPRKHGSGCVEVAPLAPHIAVRDSKNPETGTLTLSPEADVGFVGPVRPPLRPCQKPPTNRGECPPAAVCPSGG